MMTTMTTGTDRRSDSMSMWYHVPAMYTVGCWSWAGLRVRASEVSVAFLRRSLFRGLLGVTVLYCKTVVVICNE